MQVLRISFLLFWSVTALCLSAPALAATKTKVRVGHYTVSGYQERDFSGRMTGYSNEYLHRVAQIANWELEYVFTSLADGLEMLEDGRVDILGLVLKTPEREAHFDFPRLYSGLTTSVQATLPSNAALVPRDMNSWQGKRIGLVHKSERSQHFLELMYRHNVDIVPVFYYAEETMLAALNEGRLDAVTLGRSRNDAGRKILLEYDYHPFYFVTSKGNTKIHQDLDAAIGEMELRYPAFVNKLSLKYFPPWSGGSVVLTEEEKAFVAANPVQRVAFDAHWYPIEYRDESTGAVAGVGKDILELIGQKSGLRFEYVSETGGVSTVDMFLAGKCDIISGFSSNAAFVGEHMASQPYLSIPIALIGNKNFIFGVNMEHVTVALPAEYSSMPRIVQEERPNYKIVYYPTSDACVQAVLNGEADLTAENIYVAQHRILQKHSTLAIIDTTSGNFEPQFIVATHVSSLLVDIFEKCIASIHPREVENIFFKYASLTYKQEGISEANTRVRTLLVVALVALIFLSLFAWHLAHKNRQVRSALDRAEAANQTKTEFFKNLSHELRTPINAVMGLTQTCLADMSNVGMVRTKLEKILTAAQHLLGLINHILNMSKIDAGKIQIHPTNENMPEKFHFLEEMCAVDCAQARITLHPFFDQRISKWLVFDTVKTDQVLINLLGNAVKFTPPGGDVYFEARLEEKQERRERVCFVIRDTGVGMEEELLRKIFVPFEHSRVAFSKECLPTPTQGTGLGMPIAQKLAHLMGGSLDIESEPGKGTTVRFCLWCPLGEAPPENAALEEERVDISGLRVLLAEDVEINREIVVEVLHAQGVAVDTACNGEEACQCFAASAPGQYALIFMDVMMPVMDGYTATANIRASAHPDAARVPIVALTAHAFADDIAEARQSGMNAHLAKPFQTEDLYAMLRRYARRA